MPATTHWQARLVQLGQRWFPFRLLIGLAFAFLGIQVLHPVELFSEGYRAIHTAAIACILGGLALRAWGGGTAGGHTRSGTIEAPRLITGGPFAHLRNPIYGGTILLGIGMSVLIGDPLAIGLATLAFVVLYFSIVPAEEQFLRQKFGEDYERYCKEVPRLVPRIRPWREGKIYSRFYWGALRGEAALGLLVVAIYAALVFAHGRQ